MPTETATALPIDRLYLLLPDFVRLRDSEQGEPLRALLQVITEQVDLLEEDLQRLYDNWFIETCEPWAVAYIADLIGHQPIHEAGEPGEDAGSLVRNAVLLPRREVAHTLGYRRRKGTLALLEWLARDVAGWPARAVEFGMLLAQTQSLRLPRPERGRAVDLRASSLLQGLGGGFDGLARTPDLRRIISTRTPGHHAPPSVGVFVWRLKAYPITRAPAACLEGVGPNCFSFSVLGNDLPLFNRPRPPHGRCHMNDALDLPEPIGRAAFTAPPAPGKRLAHASSDYYGLHGAGDAPVAQSLAIWAPGWSDQGHGDAPIPAARIIPADLEGWVYQPPRDHVAVDPVLGRIAFPPRQAPKRAVTVSYHYGFAADIGGGEYTRPLQQHTDAELIRVKGVEALREALKRWRRVEDAHGAVGAPADQPRHAVIELGDSGAYVLPLHIFLAAGHSLQLRAAQRTRPVLRLLDWLTSQTDNMVVEGEAGSRFTLDGLMVAGRGVQLEGALASFHVRHSTLVPGWSLEPNCDPARPSEPSIELVDCGACIVIEHSIVGSIQINNDEVRTDPVPLRISDSVVDATGSDCEGAQCEAVGASGSRLAFATLRIARSTVIGRVMTHAIESADDSLFMGRVTVARRQIGCVRFCYLSPHSRTPRRFQCQPDMVEDIAARRGRADGDTPERIEATRGQERLRVRPRFDSTRYGTPTYCRLSLACAPEIVRGAGDESEMGVYHDLYQPQRTANLQSRLEEFSPAATDTGIVFAN
ncbi:hypothetical protein [Variovorax sp. JS1663]|uniref:hypothetical protein n=1 Tax=Variovorax sp. JS1663 TaxID=1851577 RepID=UPI000B347CDE|nr:hypothetical protein [Variovorax sp. JS1663]OUL98509.1 hypothetical protein A8M77_31085 [Variovorax sp. JS1663]